MWEDENVSSGSWSVYCSDWQCQRLSSVYVVGMAKAWHCVSSLKNSWSICLWPFVPQSDSDFLVFPLLEEGCKATSLCSFLPSFLTSLMVFCTNGQNETLEDGCEPLTAILGSVVPFLSCREVVNGGIVVGVWTVWTPCPGIMWLYCLRIFLILSASASYLLAVQSVNFSGVWGHMFLIYDDLTQSTHIFVQINCAYLGLVQQVLFFSLWGKSHSCAQLSWLYAFLFYWQLLFWALRKD